jgi:two-component system, sensor histidine kinase and response regulator
MKRYRQANEMIHSGNMGPAFDLDIALAHVDGDRQFLAELAALFVQDYPRLRDEARESILKGDHSSLERAAHTLKGRLAFFGIRKAREQAIALEMMGRTGDLSRAQQVLADVEREMESVLLEFESLSRAQNP